MSVKRYRVDYQHGVVEDDGSHDYWPATTSFPMVPASDFDAIASRLEEAERLRDQAYSHEDGYLQTIGKLEDNCCKAMDERDAIAKRLDEVERGPWVSADKAPAGHGGIVRVEMAEGMWRYEFGEWRVVRGVEGWFNNEGGALIGVTLWMPIPDDTNALKARP